jgi:class 3 adenylate cyclase
MALADLDALLADFEEQVALELAAAGLTLVKFLGDGAMFTGSDAAAVVSTAIDLVARFRADADRPELRAGVASGEVVARRGDYYGVPVIVAARLLGVAQPSTVVVPAGLADQVGVTAPRDEVTLAGFSSPIEVARLAGDQPRSTRSSRS